MTVKVTVIELKMSFSNVARLHSVSVCVFTLRHLRDITLTIFVRTMAISNVTSVCVIVPHAAP